MAPQIWRIDEHQPELRSKVQRSYQRAYARGLEDTVVLSDSHTFADDQLYFVIGTSLSALLGYARCIESAPGPLATQTHLDGLNAGLLYDSAGSQVTRDILYQYDSFAKYTGTGKILDIYDIEMFVRGKGYGSRLLRHMQSQEYELLTALAHDSDQFFMRHGFVHTGIVLPDEVVGNVPVLAWNNPAYAR